MALPGNCAYFRTCMDYLLSSVWESDHVVPEEFRELLDPNYDRCFCPNCMPGMKYEVKQAGEPQRPVRAPGRCWSVCLAKDVLVVVSSGG